MELSDGELRFLQRRRSLTRRWLVVGTGLIAAIVGGVLILQVRNPLLVNPWQVEALLRDQKIPATTLEQMATLLPTMFLACCGMLVFVVVVQFVAVANERRLLRILDRALSE